MPNGRALVLAQISPHPRDTFPADDVVRVDHLLYSRYGRDMATNHNGRAWRQLADHPAHFAHLGYVHDDRGNPDHIVVMLSNLALEIFPGGKIENRARRGNVCLDQHDAPGTMEHAQREAALRPCDLIVVKLHRIDGAAAELVVSRVWAEDGTQQEAGLRSLGMFFNAAGICNTRGKDFHFFSSSVSPHMPLFHRSRPWALRNK